jgi:hypothetical protein
MCCRRRLKPEECSKQQGVYIQRFLLFRENIDIPLLNKFLLRVRNSLPNRPADFYKFVIDNENSVKCFQTLIRNSACMRERYSTFLRIFCKSLPDCTGPLPWTLTCNHSKQKLKYHIRSASYTGCIFKAALSKTEYCIKGSISAVVQQHCPSPYGGQSRD